MKFQNMGICVKSIGVKKRLYEEVLTEVAEIVYCAFGLKENHLSTVIGSGCVLPNNLPLSRSDKKGSHR